MKKLFDAFISYGRADSKAFATNLYKRLTEQGLKVWFDQNDIPLGVDFQNQIDDGIEHAHNFLFIIAPHSVKSLYCLKEIQLAIKHNKRIIPILHVEPNDCWDKMHPTIGKINWVYFREEQDNFETAFAGLVSLIRKHSDYVEQHTRFLDKALEWDRNQRQTSYLLVGDERVQAESWLKIRFKEEQPPCEPTDLHCEFICESTKNAHNLMTQVFISYSEKDQVIMEQVGKSLRHEGFTIWTNKSDIKTGTEFQEEINKGIEQADNFLYLISPNSIQSKYCKDELAHAFANNKRIISLLVEETEIEQIPSQLRGLQFINFKDYKNKELYHTNSDKLLKIIKQEAHYYEQHKVLLVKSLKWLRQNRNSSILLRGYNLQQAEAWLKLAKQRREHPPLPLHEEFITSSLNQPTESSLEVFVSYSRSDSDLARKLNDALQIQGKTTWFDQESIASGSDFQQEIYRGIENSDNFLFIISPKSVQSPYCSDEVEYAQKLNKRFVTVLHQEVALQDLHPTLAKVQWIDFNQHGGDFYANFSELVRTLDTDREHVHNHTKWSQRALEWENAGKSKDLLLRGSEFAIAENWLQESEQQQKHPLATPLQQDYISKSREALLAGRKQEKRRLVVLRSLLGLVSVALVVAVIQYKEAQRNRLQAEQQSSITKAAFVENLLATKPLEGLVLAIEATGSSESLLHQVPKEVQSSLLEAIQVAQEGTIERKILRGYEGYVYAVAISPDGKLIASGDGSGKMRFWDLHGNPVGKPFKRHEGGVYSISFSPDGKTIASGSDDNTVRLWDLTGNPIGQPFKGHQRYVTSVAFSPDGKTIASGSDDNTIRLWDLTGNPIGQPFKGHDSSVTSVAFSPNGKTIASSSNDLTVRLWDLKGKPIGQPFKGHESSVKSIAFSPNGQTIVSGGFDNTVRLWNLKGKPIGQPFRRHQGAIFSVAFSPDGQTVISGSTDNTVRLWDLQGNPIGQPFKGHERFIRSLAVSPDGEVVISGSEDTTLRVWDLKSNLFDRAVRKHENSVTSVAFSPDGQYILSGCYDGKVRLWGRKGNLIGQPFQGHQKGIYSVAFSPNSKLIVSGSEDKTVRLWDLKGNPVGQPFKGHEGSVLSVAFSPDGTMIASASEDKTIRLWDLKGNAITPPFRGHQDKVYSVAFSPDGKIIASASEDQTVRLWDLKGNPVSQPFGGYEHFARSVAFSPDGQTLVSSGDRTVQLWDLKGNPIGQPFKGHEGGIFSVAFSPNGQAIISSSEDNTIRLWDLKGNPIGQPFKGHEGGIWSVAFSPDGQTIASGSWDSTMRLWEGGTSWRDWLRIGCNRLRGHSALVDPQTDVAKVARETCQRDVWSQGQ